MSSPGRGSCRMSGSNFFCYAVIALIASDLLFARYPTADEGTLTQYRAALVRASTLALFAEELSLGTYLRLGRGEEATVPDAPLLLASAFEAVVGALYLDGKLPVARRLPGAAARPRHRADQPERRAAPDQGRQITAARAGAGRAWRDSALPRGRGVWSLARAHVRGRGAARGGGGGQG